MTCRAVTSGGACTGSSSKGNALSYDNEGRLASWQSTPTTPLQSASYLYDGEGNRIEQVATAGGGATTTTSYIGSLEEVTTNSSGTTTTAYYGGLAESVNGSLSYLLSDGLGSVSESVNTSGSVSAIQLYGPYGSVRYQSGTLPTSKGFTGQRSDASTSGLDYYNARYYDPVAGQFTSADTTLAGGLNRYAYVGGNPETVADPSGHVEEPPDERVGGDDNQGDTGPGGGHGDGGGTPGGGIDASDPFANLRRAIGLAPGQDAKVNFTMGHGQDLLVYFNGSQLLLTYTIYGKQVPIDVTNTPELGMWETVLETAYTTPHVLNQGIQRRLSQNPGDPMLSAAEMLQRATGGILTNAAGNGWLVTANGIGNTPAQFRLMNGTTTPAKNAGAGPYLRIQIGSKPNIAPAADDPYLDPYGDPISKMNGTGQGTTHFYLGPQAGNNALILALAFTLANTYAAQEGSSYPNTP